MSLIRQGILKSMSGLQPFEGDGISAEFIFPKDFVGFQGHFENNPILPGVCKIQAVIVMHEEFQHKTFRLIEVSQAKYFLPVTVDQKITLQCHSKLNPETGLTTVKVLVQKEKEKIAMLQLIIQAQG